MGDIPYVCLYTRYLQTLAPFSDAERGRIMTAMLTYSTTGEVPKFEENERFIWPTIQAQIDRDISAYQEKCAKNRANGAKGGRPPKTQTDMEKTERFSEEPKKANTNTKTTTKTNTKSNDIAADKAGCCSAVRSEAEKAILAPLYVVTGCCWVMKSDICRGGMILQN